MWSNANVCASVSSGFCCHTSQNESDTEVHWRCLCRVSPASNFQQQAAASGKPLTNQNQHWWSISIMGEMFLCSVLQSSVWVRGLESSYSHHYIYIYFKKKVQIQQHLTAKSIWSVFIGYHKGVVKQSHSPSITALSPGDGFVLRTCKYLISASRNYAAPSGKNLNLTAHGCLLMCSIYKAVNFSFEDSNVQYSRSFF